MVDPDEEDLEEEGLEGEEGEAESELEEDAELEAEEEEDAEEEDGELNVEYIEVSFFSFSTLCRTLI